MSSAYKISLEEGEREISDRLLIYIITRRGPKIKP